jgi:hypothetical protein
MRAGTAHAARRWRTAPFPTRYSSTGQNSSPRCTRISDDTETPALEELLEFLQSTRNFDFHAYKRPTLTRRIERRMSLVGTPTSQEYQSYLQNEPAEFAQLFNMDLINVTNFFRDDVPWDFLASDVLPKILEEKHPQEPVRVWSRLCDGAGGVYRRHGSGRGDGHRGVPVSGEDLRD